MAIAQFYGRPRLPYGPICCTGCNVDSVSKFRGIPSSKMPTQYSLFGSRFSKGIAKQKLEGSDFTSFYK